KKVVNVVYVGIAAYLLDISLDCVHEAINRQFNKKPKAVELNNAAADAGYAWAEEVLSSQSNYVIRPCKKAAGKILIEGNQATALGLLFGGFHMAAWYPITPSTSVVEYLARYARKYRSDPETGKATYAIVQAEDELAAIGMVLGAGWAGARSVTATSGPGISLMAEMAGLSYFAEIPAVIVDVQRMGPSTGLPTRNSQGDIAKAYYLSHGDCRHVLLIPGNVQECYEFAVKALDLAEQLQTLVFLMTDLDFGMNSWMADPFPAPAGPLERGKVLDAEALAKVEDWGRYRDIDGDGVPYRTLPGTPHPNAAYFTRGTGHDEYARYSEKPAVWQGNMDRLLRNFDTARTLAPKPVVDVVKGAEVGIIAYGSSDPAVQVARDMLLCNHGLKTNYLRLRALPMNEDVRTFIERQKIVYVVEQNRDAQVKGILLTEYPQLGTRLDSVLHYTGIPIDAESIAEKIIEKYGQ
ncbi:MAG: 2-oxoacid:acceptor oxidoreductase family protein, partial [Candidatus Hydrogenedentes bacterium]|nr:2-oxoacid:acceptor oxidoreductase family protein [Candidatus Hydrogenedentota bacterium]